MSDLHSRPTVQVPNLALTHTKRITVYSVFIFIFLRQRRADSLTDFDADHIKYWRSGIVVHNVRYSHFFLTIQTKKGGGIHSGSTTSLHKHRLCGKNPCTGASGPGASQMPPSILAVDCGHRLNMEVDLQSLFGLHVT